MRLAAARTFWTAASSRPISTAMMAMTTSSSMSVKPGERRRVERGCLMETVLSAGVGQRGSTSALSQRHRPVQTDCNHACRMLEAEASEQELGRQVFWLTARSGPEQPSRRRSSKGPSAVASLSSGPGRSQQRPCNGFAPFSLFVPLAPWREAGNLSRSTPVAYGPRPKKASDFS